MIKHLLPKRIIKIDGVIKNYDNLYIKKNIQIGLNETNVTELIGNSSIVLDFGKELCGGIRILCANHSNTPAKLRICFGESISECLSKIGEKNSSNDHSLREFIIETTNLSDLKVGDTGFRFVKIEKLTKDVNLCIKSILAISHETSKKQEGYFISDDITLNEIYNVAAHTVKLCVQNGYVWDGIKRDRLIWIGDLHPEFLSLSCLYKNLSEIKKSMSFVKKQTPLPNWMNNIPMYSLWWIIILHDYYYKTCDYRYLKENINYLIELIDQIYHYVDQSGKTNFPYNFIDWPTSNSSDLTAGVHALTIIALKKAKNILDIVNINTGKVEILLDTLLKVNHNIKEKKQVKALSSIAYEQYDNLSLSFLIKQNSKGFSTFMSYYILESIFKCGGKDESIDILKEYYGAMIDMGATSFFEDFDISWCKDSFRIDELPDDKLDLHGDFGDYCYKGFRHSLCHGWASGPVAFLTKYIAGIYPLDAGDKKLLIKPYLGNLNRINCCYPTIHGLVMVEHKKDKDGVILTNVKAPKEIEYILEDCVLVKNV